MITPTTAAPEDCAVFVHPSGIELLTHTAALARGWHFVGAWVSLEHFQHDGNKPLALPTNSRILHVCPTEGGVNVYTE